MSFKELSKKVQINEALKDKEIQTIVSFAKSLPKSADIKKEIKSKFKNIEDIDLNLIMDIL